MEIKRTQLDHLHTIIRVKEITLKYRFMLMLVVLQMRGQKQDI